MDYRLHVFRAVGEELSFTRAARRLHLSQPAVTKHVRLLEEQYGVPLFHRTPGGTGLTPAGLLLLEHARTMERLDAQVEQQLRSRGGVPRGTLRLGASATIFQYLLPDWLVRSRRAWPELALEAAAGNTEQVLGSLLARRIDLAMIEGPCARPELDTEAFLDDELVCVAAPGHPLARKGKATLKEALREPLIVREPGSGTRETLEAALEKRKVPLRGLRVDLELGRTEAIKGVVAAGHGLSFLSRFAVARDVAAGRLRIVPIPGFRILRPLRFAYPKGPRPAGAAGAFIGLVAGSLPAP